MIFIVYYTTDISSFQIILEAENIKEAETLADSYLAWNHPAIFAHCHDIRVTKSEGINFPQIINYKKEKTQ